MSVRKVDYEVVFRFEGVLEAEPDPAEMKHIAEIIASKFKEAPFKVAVHEIRELEVT